MASSSEIKTICECQYTITVSDNKEAMQETKRNFNNVLSIHEIDEEESEIDETTNSELNPLLLDRNDKQNDEHTQEIKDLSDYEYAYTGESFCSDESYSDSDVTSVTPESLISESFSLTHVSDLQHNDNSTAQADERNKSQWKNDLKSESYSLDDVSSRVTTADRFPKSKRCRKWNMTFTDDEMRKIERENELLLRKIMAQQKPRHKILGECVAQPRTSSSAINRRKLQKKIEDDNMLLLRRIQQAKSRILANTSKMGCRLTIL